MTSYQVTVLMRARDPKFWKLLDDHEKKMVGRLRQRQLDHKISSDSAHRLVVVGDRIGVSRPELTKDLGFQ